MGTLFGSESDALNLNHRIPRKENTLKGLGDKLV
jgi:hypothetical protein